jgi:hypothetical protein
MNAVPSNHCEKRNAYKISVGKPEGKTPLERNTYRIGVLTLK